MADRAKGSKKPNAVDLNSLAASLLHDIAEAPPKPPMNFDTHSVNFPSQPSQQPSQQRSSAHPQTQTNDPKQPKPQRLTSLRPPNISKATPFTTPNQPASQTSKPATQHETTPKPSKFDKHKQNSGPIVASHQPQPLLPPEKKGKAVKQPVKAENSKNDSTTSTKPPANSNPPPVFTSPQPAQVKPPKGKPKGPKTDPNDDTNPLSATTPPFVNANLAETLSPAQLRELKKKQKEEEAIMAKLRKQTTSAAAAAAAGKQQSDKPEQIDKSDKAPSSTTIFQPVGTKSEKLGKGDSGTRSAPFTSQNSTTLQDHIQTGTTLSIQPTTTHTTPSTPQFTFGRVDKSFKSDPKSSQTSTHPSPSSSSFSPEPLPLPIAVIRPEFVKAVSSKPDPLPSSKPPDKVRFDKASDKSTPQTAPSTASGAQKPTPIDKSQDFASKVSKLDTQLQYTSQTAHFHPLLMKEKDMLAFTKVKFIAPPQTFTELYTPTTLHPLASSQKVPLRPDYKKCLSRIKITPEMLQILPIELQQKAQQWADWVTALDARLLALKPKFWTAPVREWPTASNTNKVKKQLFAVLQANMWIFAQQTALMKAIHMFERMTDRIDETIDLIEDNFFKSLQGPDKADSTKPSPIRAYLKSHCDIAQFFTFPIMLPRTFVSTDTIPYKKVPTQFQFQNFTATHFAFIAKNISIRNILFKSYYSSKPVQSKLESLLSQYKSSQAQSTSAQPECDQKITSTMEMLFSGIDLSSKTSQNANTAAIDPRYFGHSTPLKLTLTGLPYFTTLPMLHEMFNQTKPIFPTFDGEDNNPFHPNQPLPSTTTLQYDRCWLKQGKKSEFGGSSAALGTTNGDKKTTKATQRDQLADKRQSTIHVGGFGPEFSTAFITFNTYNECLVFKTTFSEFEYVISVPGSMQIAKYVLNVSIPLNTYVPLLPFDGDDTAASTDDKTNSNFNARAAVRAMAAAKKGRKVTPPQPTVITPQYTPEEEQLLSQSKWLTTAHFKDFLTDLLTEVKNSQPTNTSSVFGAKQSQHQLVGSAAMVQQMESERQAKLQSLAFEQKKLEQYFNTAQGRRQIHLKAEKERELLAKRPYDPLNGLSAAFGQGLGVGRTANMTEIQLPIIDQLVKKAQQPSKRF